MTDSHVDDRLRTDSVAWMSTVDAQGQPQSSPVWFIHHGGDLWLRSKAGPGKVRNIETNPKVSLHLADDGRGADIVTMEGTAAVRDSMPPTAAEAYLAKYGEAIRTALETTPEQLELDYPVTISISITPTRTRAW